MRCGEPYWRALSAAKRKICDIMQGLVFDECEIGWEVSEYHTPFLDLLVYLDPADGSVQHKPYKKPMNHRERIPWTSAHPKDVKKGTFTGEMSRLAVLSSKPEHYLEAIADLQNLYIACRYPTNLGCVNGLKIIVTNAGLHATTPQQSPLEKCLFLNPDTTRHGLRSTSTNFRKQ